LGDLTIAAADESSVEVFSVRTSANSENFASARSVVLQAPIIGAEKFLSERASIEIIRKHGRYKNLITRAHLLKPDAILAAQRFAPVETDEAGAVSLFPPSIDR